MFNAETPDNQFWNYENQRWSCSFAAEETFPQSGHCFGCPETRFNRLRQKLRKKIP
jgi:hypothetical protein